MFSLSQTLSLAVLGLAASAGASPVSIEERFIPENFQPEMINAHNFYRRQHGAPPLTWNPAAAANAQNWVAGCPHEHQPNNKFGENLFWGGGQAPAWGDYVNGWAGEEREKYDFNNPGFSLQTGHFTQVVWAGTTSVGCAWKMCNGQTMVACEFSPPGNYLGDFPKNVLRQVQGLPSDRYHRKV